MAAMGREQARQRNSWNVRKELLVGVDLCTEVGILAFYGYKEPEKYMKLNFLIWMVIFTILVAFRFVGTWHFESYWNIRSGLEHLPDSYHIATAYVYEFPSMLLFIWFWIKRDELVPES